MSTILSQKNVAINRSGVSIRILFNTLQTELESAKQEITLISSDLITVLTGILKTFSVTIHNIPYYTSSYVPFFTTLHHTSLYPPSCKDNFSTTLVDSLFPLNHIVMLYQEPMGNSKDPFTIIFRCRINSTCRILQCRINS